MEPRIDKLVSIFNHKMRTELNFQYEKIGLSAKNYFYLEKIAETPGISQAQFIKILHRDQSVITRQINKLVADGWISKRFSDKDHRRSELFLTSKGEAILPKIKDIYRQVNQNSLASLTASEAKVFGDLLAKVTTTYQPHNSTEV